MNAMLRVDDLRVWHQNQELATVNGVSWSQKAGEIVFLLGRNGSGKSTVLRALAGDPRVRRGGRIVFRGATAEVSSSAWRRQGVRWIPQYGASFQELSVRENLELAAAAEGAASVDAALDLFPDLKVLLPHQVRHLSGGEQRMTDLAPLALARDISMFWLDEPIAPLSPKNAASFQEFLRSRVESGVSLIIASHRQELAVGPHHVVVLNHARD